MPQKGNWGGFFQEYTEAEIAEDGREMHGDEKWVRCWNELESIEYPEEWSQGEASTPSRTPSPERIIEDKMMGGKLWRKVDKLFFLYFTALMRKDPLPHPICQGFECSGCVREKKHKRIIVN